ncbi:MAG: hypothetical protein QOJ15_4707 [Bradyrhizobium sp.]|nr:hypothetical protein [Bradyrhizobium sp.]
MIVRHFLNWSRTASVAERADATYALARAYLETEFTAGERAAAEGALIALLDDPSPTVRAAMAQALAPSEFTPPTIVHTLAADLPEVAGWMLEQSPLLVDADLVEAVAIMQSGCQVAVATRAKLSAAVSAAIAEVGSAEACLALIENPGAVVAKFSIDRVVARHGHLAPIREALLARSDLAVSTHQALVAKLSETLANFAVARDGVERDQAMRMAKDACERATVALAAASPRSEIKALVTHLRDSGQLTAGLLLRALLCGNVDLLEHVLAELAAMPLARVRALVHDRRSAGFRALYDKAGLPASAYLAFREALEALQEGGFAGSTAEATCLKRRMVERVLTRCADEPREDIEPLLTLLRRFSMEAAREEARLYCETLVGNGTLSTRHVPEQIAA